MKNIKLLLSYLFPFTQKRQSVFSGNLEVTLINGRKVLDSAHANYSYGSLQRILKFGLTEIFNPNINSVLVLGLGGGSVIETLRNEFNFNKHITAVEIDPVVIQIARDEFGISTSDNLVILCEDAYSFIHQNTQRFDLIIVDLFIDNTVPDKFLTPSFWQAINQRLHTSGVILFNSMHNNIDPIKNILSAMGYTTTEHHKVENTNTLLIAVRIQPHP
jgi:spermidine synthase